MGLTDAVQQLSDYLNKSIASANDSFEASSVRSQVQPAGQLQAQLTNQTSASTLDSVSQNPVANAAIDTVNSTVTGLATALVSTAISKVNLTPIQNATQQFFTLFASVTSFGTEVAMAFARNTGNNILTAIKQKDATAAALEAEITALYNACAILLGGQPFFNQMLKNLLQAYTLMLQADKSLKLVADTLADPNNPVYLTQKFNQSIAELQQAQALILPNNNADISSVRGVTSFVGASIKSQSNINTYAAALTIPGITIQVATLILTYEVQSLALNALLNTYENALLDYISGYKQSASVNQATIDHINSGVSQLDNLLADMNTLLSQNSNAPTNVTYKTQLSSSTLVWGVKLAGIIAWLQANPGAGSALLTQTSASVMAFTKSVVTLSGLGDIKFPGGTLFRVNGEEDAFKGLVPLSARLLVSANTIVATSQSKTSVLTQAQAVKNYLDTSRASDANIVAAITPFINTKTTLSGPVDAAVQQLIAFSNKAGLDRIAGLISNGDVSNLFSVTPDTSTYAGAAVTGINSILTTLTALPNATTQQVSQIESLRTQVQRDQKAQEVYAGRSAQATQNADVVQRQASVALDKMLVRQATATAQQLDSSVSDPATQTEQILTPQVMPGSLPSASDLTAGIA